MIDAGTISASLILDTEPFSNGLEESLNVLARLGLLSDEQGGRISSLGDVLRAVGGRVHTEFESPIVTGAGAIASACLGITGAVGRAAQEVLPAAAGIKNNILTPVRAIVPESNSIMKDFGQGMINGLVSKQAAIIAKAKGIANSVASAMRKALGIASPSRVMREVGHFTVEGMVLGLQDMSGEVERASKGIAQSAAVSVTADTDFRKAGAETFKPEADFSVRKTENSAPMQDVLSRKLDVLIDLLSNGRQAIELDRRTFGVLVREYT